LALKNLFVNDSLAKAS